MTIALTARDAKCRASELLDVDDPRLALEFDIACTYRLLVYDNEREADRFKSLAMILGASGDDDEYNHHDSGNSAEDW